MKLEEYGNLTEKEKTCEYWTREKGCTYKE